MAKTSENLFNVMNTVAANANAVDNTFAIDTSAKTMMAPRKRVNPNILVPHPNNNFSMKKDAEYEILKKAIAQDGITNDIIVTPDPSDSSKYILISGHRRAEIAKELGIDSVWIKIKQFDDPISETAFIIKENIGTRQKQPLDIALSIQTLEKMLGDNVKGRKRDAVAEMLGMSSRNVYNYSLLIDLNDGIKNWLSEGLTTLHQLNPILNLSKELQQELYSITEGQLNGIDAVSEKKRIIQAAISKYGKAAAPKSQKKPVDIVKKIKKTHSLLKESIDAYTIPKRSKKIQEATEEIEETIKLLEELKAKLQAGE